MPFRPSVDTFTPTQLEEVQRLLAAGFGTTTSSCLRALGLGDAHIAALRRDRLVRVGRGAYVDRQDFEQASPERRHVLRATAVARTWPPDVVISHQSGAVVLELPLPVLTDRIHGCRISTGQHRKNAIYTIHTGYAGATAMTINGVRVLEPRFVVMGVAEELGRDAAVMAADDALHRRLVDREGLLAACDARPNHPAHAVMREAIDLTEPATESPGETRCRLLLLALGFAPIPQVEIRDDSGSCIARVDFVIEGTKVVVEFDGMAKYASHEDLVKEKRRELRLQREGYVVVRLVWADLGQPERVRTLIRNAVAAAA